MEWECEQRSVLQLADSCRYKQARQRCEGTEEQKKRGLGVGEAVDNTLGTVCLH